MDQRTRTGTLLAVGYGCYQAVSSSGYLTAMGTVSTNLGFVTSLPFMVGGCVLGAAAALAVAWASRLRPPRVPAAGLTGIYLLFCLLPFCSGPLTANLEPTTASALLGSLRGVCTSCISLTWIALFVRHATRDLPVLYMAAFALSSLAGLTIRAVSPDWTAQALTIALLLASFAGACALLSHKTPVPEKTVYATGLVRLSSEQGWTFYASWSCALVCEFLVGITNTAVFNSDFSAAMANVNMSLCMLTAVALLAALFVFMRKAPNPTIVFKACMPIMLAVFSVMALVTDRLGALSGTVMVVCYDMIALAFSIYLVTFLHEHGYNPYLNAGVAVGASNLTLLLGLAIGTALNALWSSQGVPLLTLLAFTAIYLVGFALFFVQKAHGHRSVPAVAEPAARDTATPTGEQVEGYYAASVAEFARTHALTPRESQICALLVRGRSVRFAAQELGISENTAWTHTKNLYAKCGVGTKQDLMDLFEKGKPGAR